MASKAHQQENSWARGKVRNREIYGSWRKKLGGVKLVHQENLRDKQIWVINNEKGNILAYHALDRADEPHMNLVLLSNLRTVTAANSPLACEFPCW